MTYKLTTVEEENAELKAKNTRLEQTILLMEENTRSVYKRYQGEIRDLIKKLHNKNIDLENNCKKVTDYERVLSAFGYDAIEVKRIFNLGYIEGHEEGYTECQDEQ